MIPGVVSCLRVKDGMQYLPRYIDQVKLFSTNICILDDGSTDGSREFLSQEARKDKKIFLHFQRNLPFNEGRDYNILFDMAKSCSASWIWCADVDELIDEEDLIHFHSLFLSESEFPMLQGWTFPFYYLWDSEEQYRCDGWYRNVHVIRLFRFHDEQRPANKIIHGHMCSEALNRHWIWEAPVRVKHLGYIDEKNRTKKVESYKKLDCGSYDHILDGNIELHKYENREKWMNSYKENCFV